MKLNVLNRRVFGVLYKFSNGMEGFFALRYNAEQFDKPYDEAGAIAAYFCNKLETNVNLLSIRLLPPALTLITNTLSYEKVVAQNRRINHVRTNRNTHQKTRWTGC